MQLVWLLRLDSMELGEEVNSFLNDPLEGRGLALYWLWKLGLEVFSPGYYDYCPEAEIKRMRTAFFW